MFSIPFPVCHSSILETFTTTLHQKISLLLSLFLSFSIATQWIIYQIEDALSPILLVYLYVILLLYRPLHLVLMVCIKFHQAHGLIGKRKEPDVIGRMCHSLSMHHSQTPTPTPMIFTQGEGWKKLKSLMWETPME